MSNEHVLLTDEQVQQFLVNGYLQITPQIDSSIHKQIYNKTKTVFEKDGNPGNNIYPAVPELLQIYEDPVVSGALKSLLGNNYTMQAHRHPHMTKPGTKEQQWHKDSYFGYGKQYRHHQVRYVMAMYYPQAVTQKMGPTAIKPNSQFDVRDPRYDKDTALVTGKNHKDDVYVTCPAGSVVIIHYDLIHKGTANTTNDQIRFMFKFQFSRLDEPTEPTWNHDTKTDNWNAVEAGPNQPVVKHVWKWMLGKKNTIGENEMAETYNANDRTRMGIAYQFAQSGQLKPLISMIKGDNEKMRDEATYALAAYAKPEDLIKYLKDRCGATLATSIAFALCEMADKESAKEAIPALINAANGLNKLGVTQYVCEALGTICNNSNNENTKLAVKFLMKHLADRNISVGGGKANKGPAHVRFTAALSLARIGKGAEPAIQELQDALHIDPNRYVNSNALLALKRIGTQESLRIVSEYENEHQGWCSKTTPNSLF